MHIEIPGYKDRLFVDDVLAANLDRVKISVLSKGWDYVGVVSGLPGVGKSTFAQSIAKYLDRDFESWQICFTAQDFIKKITEGKKGQAFILDESFADLNTSLSKDPEFIALVNTLQLIRQRNLFLILVLPDFFSLNKNMAIFRASHLFVPYSEDYSHGDVAIFDREAKRNLYMKGKQFCNYQAWSPNLRCQFNMKWFVDEEDYSKRKAEHLLKQSMIIDKGAKQGKQRDKMSALWKEDSKKSAKVMAEQMSVPEPTMEDWIRRGRELLKS